MPGPYHTKEDNDAKTKSGHLRCQEIVLDSWSNWPRYHQCERRAKVGDRCGQHDPVAIEAKRDAKDAANKGDMAARQVNWSAKKFLRALQQIAAGHNDPRTLAKEAVEGFEDVDVDKLRVVL